GRVQTTDQAARRPRWQWLRPLWSLQRRSEGPTASTRSTSPNPTTASRRRRLATASPQSVVTRRIDAAHVRHHGIGRSPGSIGLFGKSSKVILSHCVCSCFIEPLDFCCSRKVFRKSTTLLFPFCTAHAAYDFSPTRWPSSNTSGF